MTFRTRKADFLAETAVPKGTAPQSDSPSVQSRDGPQSDDEDLLIGYPRMSEFAIAQNFPVSTSTIQKRGSPAIATGPELVGYFGQLPATTKGLMRKWLRAQLRPNRQANKRWGRQRAETASP
jgi:hypothetical protein